MRLDRPVSGVEVRGPGGATLGTVGVEGPGSQARNGTLVLLVHAPFPGHRDSAVPTGEPQGPAVARSLVEEAACLLEVQGTAYPFSHCQRARSYLDDFWVYTSMERDSRGRGVLRMGVRAQADDGWVGFGLSHTKTMAGGEVAVTATDDRVPSGATISRFTLFAPLAQRINAANGTFSIPGAAAECLPGEEGPKGKRRGGGGRGAWGWGARVLSKAQGRAVQDGNGRGPLGQCKSTNPPLHDMPTDGTLVGVFTLLANDTFANLASAPQYFLFARGPLDAPGVLGAHFDPMIDYPYGGIHVALSSVFDYAVDIEQNVLTGASAPEPEGEAEALSAVIAPDPEADEIPEAEGNQAITTASAIEPPPA